MFLSNVSIKRPVFATVLMLSLATLGVFSYRRLAIDLFPDVEIPVLSIVTPFPGASPETVEREVTRKVEEAVNPIAGVKHVFSSSREGVSSVIVEFELNVRINEASQEARAKLNAVRGELPADIEDPVIQKLDIGGAAIVSLAVRSDTMPPRELTTLVDRRVKRRLENLAGVGKAEVVGATKREVGVEVDPSRLAAFGMGVDEVIAGLRSENVNTPLGRLNAPSSEVPVRVSGKPVLVEDFASMVVARRGKTPIPLGQVAKVVDGSEEVRSLAFVNGVPAVAIDIYKQSKANTVGVVEAVKKEIGKLQGELPSSVTIEMVRDGSIMIRESVHDVQVTLVLGGVLTVLIVFCFLNSWRSTVITGLTLPISVISSFIVMAAGGMTLNIMSLMALSLAIGLLIDDAIVVRENIVRHLERGQDHMTAAREGTAEIGLAVMATSLSIMAVFVPVAFMKGIIGRFFYQFGLTVAFAVLVSLFVSFTLDPMLSSRWVDPDVERKGRRHVVARVLDRFNAWFDRQAERYRLAIGWALDHRRSMLALAAAAFLGGTAAFFSLPSEFLPPYDQGEFQVRFRTAPDASIEETRDRLARVLAVLKRDPEVHHTYATIGAGDNGTVRDAAVYVKLTERGQRPKHQEEVRREIRARLEAIPGILPSVQASADSNEQKPVQVGIRGPEIPLLKEYAARLKDEMYRIGGLVDVEVSLEHDLPEYRLRVDRERAVDAGVMTADISRTVSALVGGQAVTTYEDEEGEAVDVRVRLPLDLRRDISQVGDLRLAVPRGDDPPALVPLSDLVRAERSTTPSEITRRDLSRQVVVTANLAGLPLGTAVQKVTEAAGRIQMAPGYRVVFAGDAEIMAETFGYMGEALVLAVLFVYFILAAQFESFIDPLAIMLSLPLSIVGMAGMLLLTGDTVNIMSLIGLILLMGLVTKNAILLVDYTKVLRRAGTPRREALIQAGRTRLRPILMTTLAMIFGMLPLALAIGQGAEMRAPMARAVVGGLVTSTILTLLVVPVVYTLLDDLAAWLHRRWLGANALEADARLAPTEPEGAAGGSEVPPVVAGAVLLALLLPSSLAYAEERVPLTLPEVLRLAAEQGRDVAKAKAYQTWVQGKYLEERSAALPQVTASGAGVRTWDGSFQAIFGDVFPAGQTVKTAEASASQLIFAWGKVGAAMRAARSGIAGAEDQHAQARQTAVRDATAAFYDVLLARALSALAHQTLSHRERRLAEAKGRHAFGTATDYDVLAASVDVENSRPAVLRAESAVRQTRDRLRFVLADPRPGLDAEGSLEGPVEDPPSHEEVLGAALERRRDLMALAHRVDVYGELARIQAAGDKPRLEAKAAAGWKWLDAGSLSAGGKTWSAGLYVSFPFFDGLATKGRVLQARSDLTTAELDLEKARDGLALEARAAVDSVKEAAEIVRGLSGTVAKARKLLEMAEKGYELGVRTRLDVQDAELNLLSAEAELARAHRDYRVARATLDWVTGQG